MKITISRDHIILATILLLSFSFNVAYINWGLPGVWHPDEVVDKSARLVLTQTLNPHYFLYPSLHIYFIALFSALPYTLIVGPSEAVVAMLDAGQVRTALDSFVPEITIYARLLSAVMGTCTVFMVYKTAKLLFDNLAAFLSALFIALTAGFSSNSHFATVDIALTFWMTLAFYCCVIALKTDDRNRYVIASFVLGLAISAKYTAILMIPTLLLAYFLNTKRPFSKNWSAQIFNMRLFVMGSAGLGGFLLGTPYALLTPIAFLKDFIVMNFIQPSQAGLGPLVFIPHLWNLYELFGLFLFLVSILGFFYLFYQTVKHKQFAYSLLLVTILVIYVKMGSVMFAPQRYVIMLVPFLTMCAGKLIADGLRIREPLRRGAVVGILIAGLGFSFYYSLAGIAEIRDDNRNLAQKWLLKNVDKGEIIEMTDLPAYGINVPGSYENVSYIPYYHYREVDLRMEESPIFQRLYALYLKIKPLQGTPQTDIEQNASPPDRSEPPETSIEALLQRKPRYLIISSQTYDRFLSEQSNAKDYFPLQHRLYTLILEGRTPYKLVADFEKSDNWLTPAIEFIDGGIKIYQYQE